MRIDVHKYLKTVRMKTLKFAITILFIYLIKFYKIISFIFNKDKLCLFKPTCSVFLYVCLIRFNLNNSITLGVSRLLICNSYLSINNIYYNIDIHSNLLI